MLYITIYSRTRIKLFPIFISFLYTYAITDKVEVANMKWCLPRYGTCIFFIIFFQLYISRRHCSIIETTTMNYTKIEQYHIDAICF